MKTNLQNSRIVIIGAGAAGIAAASKLFENNFKHITILEAEDRIGGRVHTTKFGDYLVDLGGQWVHGEEGNVVFELANQYGVLEKQDESMIEFEQKFYDSFGNTLSDNIAIRVSTFIEEYFLVKDADASFESVGEYAEKMFDEQFKNDPEILKDRSKYLHHLELLMTSWDPADSWYNISAAGTTAFRECKGDQSINWKTKGYSTILEILMKRYPNPKNELPVMKNIHLNCEVTSINYSQNMSSILVTTANGQSYETDHVIITVPLGVLKEKLKSFFIPPLPELETKAIEHLAFGSAGKIYLLFDKPFWEQSENKAVGYIFMWNDEDRKIIEDDPEKKWVLGITGINPVEHKPNLLELWIPGRYAKAMESIPENIVLNQTMEVLRKFLGKNFQVTKPKAILRTQWYTNPHFRGTCAYRSVETQKQGIYPDVLDNLATKQNMKILFAGEGMSNDRYSTVDGAIVSGWNAADKLINHYKSQVE